LPAVTKTPSTAQELLEEAQKAGLAPEVAAELVDSFERARLTGGTQAGNRLERRGPLHGALLGTPQAKLPRVVVIGGGFGGRATAKALAGRAVNVTLIDRSPDHTFVPNIFQVAAGQLGREHVLTPLAPDLGRARNTKVCVGEVSGIDAESQVVKLSDGTTLPYDYLVVAAGSQPGYFGHPEWADVTMPLKTIEDAERVRASIRMAFEEASSSVDVDRQRALLTFTMIGGGPSGVELAGSLAPWTRDLKRQYPELDDVPVTIRVVEGGPRLLASFSEQASARAHAALVEAGVEVLLSTMVEKIDAGSVQTSDGRRRLSNTIVWTAGTEGSPVGKMLSPAGRTGLVEVEPDFSLAGKPNVFVVGDLAMAKTATGRVPAVAQGATQGGTHAASCILADVAGKPRPAFQYKDYGSAAFIKPGEAIVEANGFSLSGVPGWLAWIGIHVARMPKSLLEKLSIATANLFGRRPEARVAGPSVETVANLHALPRSTNMPQGDNA
jgi:NADH dehydrogenase